MKKVISLIAISLFLIVSMQAQSDKTKQKHHKKSPEHKAELRSYYEQQIYPLLKEKYDAFDAALSQDDFNFLQSKRAEAKELQINKKVLHQQIKEVVKTGQSKEDAKAQFANQIEELKNKRNNLRESLEPLIEKNQVLIDKTKEELKSYQEQWKNDNKMIHQKYNPEGVQKEEAKQKKNKTQLNNLSEEQKLEKKAKCKSKKALKFLLWDEELKKAPEQGKKGKNVHSDSKIKNSLNSTKNYQISAFPNPAKSSTKVSFSLPKKATFAKIKVSNFKGSILREIPIENLDSGNHTVQLNLSGIESGKYILSIEVDGKLNSTKLLVP